MSNQPGVRVLPADVSETKSFGPSTMEHRTAQARFEQLGVYIEDFPEGGSTDPWTLEYEEAVFVVAGRASVTVVNPTGDVGVSAGAGEIIAIPKGSTVRYGGTPGTRLLLAMAPVNWRAFANTRDDAKPRILFLTPFNFEQAKHDSEFDTLVASLVASEPQFEVVTDHVPRFDAGDDYDAEQTKAVLEAVANANDDGFDAIVIACHYDPAVTDARAASGVPVFGPLQLTTSLATQFGPKFAVITDVPEAEDVIAGLIAGYGRDDDCTGVRAIGWTGDEILDDTWGAAQVVDRMVARIAEEGGAQSVVIACTIVSAAYETHRAKFADHGVVVLNSNLVTIKGAAALTIN
jgi:allantoin racemase